MHRGLKRFAIGPGLGAAGYALGLALSALLDLPSGAVIVWSLAVCAMLGAGFLTFGCGLMTVPR